MASVPTAPIAAGSLVGGYVVSRKIVDHHVSAILGSWS
jgi:hypothetical protein